MKTITITDPTQIEEIIRKCPYCIVGITDLEGNPYTVPMNFAYQDGVIYLHSGPEGSKVEMVTKHPQDRKSTRLNSSHPNPSRMPSSA